MTHYFISDLHLSNERLDLIQAFVSLSQLLQLENKDRHNQLHIVGDFYEAWIGDDYQAPWNDMIESSLIALSQSGMKINIYHGNRDFLIGEDWAKRVGATLIPECLSATLNHKQLLVSHGDEACLDDIEYQKFRQMVRQPQWQQHVLSMPLAQRIALASELRQDSKASNSTKMLEIMDVNDNEVDRLMQTHNTDIMIHGHTHRPALHEQANGIRLVLGDWDKKAWLAVLDEHQLNQFSISLNTLDGQFSSIDDLIRNADKTHSYHLTSSN